MLEAEKSHSLPLARWSPKKASGVTQYLYEGLRMGGTSGINSIPRAGEDDKGHPSSTEAGKGGELRLPLPFILSRPSRST